MNTYSIVTAIDRADGITREEKAYAVQRLLDGLALREEDEAAWEEACCAAEDCGLRPTEPSHHDRRPPQ